MGKIMYFKISFINNNHDAMMQYFNMNGNADNKSVACQKNLMHHFSGQFSIMEFVEMAPDLLLRSF
jgi:hypothetical protein